LALVPGGICWLQPSLIAWPCLVHAGGIVQAKRAHNQGGLDAADWHATKNCVRCRLNLVTCLLHNASLVLCVPMIHHTSWCGNMLV